MRTKPARLAAVVLLASLALVACSSKNTPKASRRPAARAVIQLTSPAFADGGDIPRKYTCQGNKLSPPLQWSGVPTGTKDLAVRVIDTDVKPRGFVHWFVFHIDPGVTSIAEGSIPPGATLGPASSGKAEYVPPCPPEGPAHHYGFRVLAFSQTLNPGGGVPPPSALLGQGQLTGLYARH
jgi:hypothetical protein